MQNADVEKCKSMTGFFGSLQRRAQLLLANFERLIYYFVQLYTCRGLNVTQFTLDESRLILDALPPFHACLF